ncbi:MAG TPA: M56 family metallopeptidase, partial [Terriglobales bacterium]
MHLESRLLSLLWNAFWQSCAIAVVAGTCLRMLRRRIAPAHQNALWILALIACLLLPIVSMTMPLPPRLSFAAGLEASALDGIWWSGSGTLTSTNVSLPRVGAAGAQAMVAAWLALIAVASLRLSRRWMRTQVLARATTLCSDAAALSLLQSLTARFEIKAPVLRCTSDYVAPFTTGIVHPVIVLPVRILNVNDEALRAALSHELAHIKRRDYAGNLLIESAHSTATTWRNALCICFNRHVAGHASSQFCSRPLH